MAARYFRAAAEALFGFEASRLGDLLETFDVGLNNFAEFRRRRQVGDRAYRLQPLLDGIFGQHLPQRLVQLVDDRLRRAGRKDQTVPAEVANPFNTALRQRRRC